MYLQHLVSYLLPVFTFLHYTKGYLLSKCSTDADCTVTHSYCYSGLCLCQPYFAQYNSSSCIPSKLLDQECIIEEQCTMKVAQSTCNGGKCKCSDGFIQFRHHTCLSAAKPGDVCLNNEHCKLWSRNSHCHYLIPNLIGRCSCNSHTRLYGSQCLTEEEAPKPHNKKPTETPAETTLATKFTPEDEAWNDDAEGDDEFMEKQSEEMEEYVFNVKTQEKDPSLSDPFYDQKKHIHDKKNAEVTTTESSGVTFEIETGTDSQTESMNGDQLEKFDNDMRNESQENVLNHTRMSYRETPEIATVSSVSTDDLNHWKGKDVISLGLPCITDKQCQAADTGSICINNVCECAEKGNETDLCGGCPTETFQCRSTGTCISWFFVCDGKADCPDGSDEECAGSPCPHLSFQCGKNGTCISRSKLCDGKINCSDGEDEALCGEAAEGCPPDTFQCKNGQCLPEYEFCNAIPACSDGSDELEALCGSQFAVEREKKASVGDDCPFRCKNGRCRSTAILCSGRNGCGDNSDESTCSVCRCPSKA